MIIKLLIGHQLILRTKTDSEHFPAEIRWLIAEAHSFDEAWQTSIVGIADRHIDLLWGVWTLNFNLHTTEFTDRFLDAYERDMADVEKLRAVAAMEAVREG